MPWFYLFLAGLLEIAWAVGLKHTEGFTRPLPSILTIGAMAVSFWFLSLALKSLPMGTAYAVWTGIGAAGTAILGMIWLGESANAVRLASLALIVLGVAGLKFAPGS